MSLLEIRDLKTHFRARRGPLQRGRLIKAVDGVSLDLDAGETVGLVGESGCGKSTLARSRIHLETPTDGRIHFDGRDVTRPTVTQLRDLRRNVQMVFQDPYGSLNPRLTAEAALAEVLRVHSRMSGAERRERVVQLLDLVGLDPDALGRFPHEFSGGQRQRIGIARALAVAPRVLLADEPVSALDVSVQAQIVNLLQDLQERLGLAYLFIAHDLPVVEHFSDRVVVMYLGRPVETAPTQLLFARPQHPYTQVLLAATPRLDRTPDPTGNPRPPPALAAAALAPDQGCAFRPRCAYAVPRCRCERPELIGRDQAPQHHVACHLLT